MLLIFVNMLLALAGSIFTFILYTQDETPFRWARAMGSFALAYIAALYAYGLATGEMLGTVYFRPAFTVVLAYILAEGILYAKFYR